MNTSARPVCRCGQTFILAGVIATGHVWAYCPHCDRPHQKASGASCANCTAYGKATSRSIHQS